MLDVSQGKIFHLNGIGALIFERLRQGENTIQIIAEISRAYGLSSEVVETDVIQFLDQLEQQGLVRRSEKVAPSCAT